MFRHRMFACLFTAAGMLVAGSAAHAQTTDLTASAGGFTAPNPNNFIGAGVWQYAAGTGWAVNGRSRESAQLLTGVYTATGGAASFAFNHSFNFELNLFGGCFDGGVLLANVNGTGFVPVAPAVSPQSVGYRGAISTSNGSTRAGQNAFCGFPNNQQASFVNSVFTTTLDAGSTVQFAFEGVWDNQKVNSGANWTIGSVTTSGLSATTVPEPSTALLLAAGLGALGFTSRSRRRAR
jgi:hypothetical protein